MRIKQKILALTLLAFSTMSFALPNPAATNCLSKGFKYLLVQNVGVCLFPDSSYCEEWAFYRGKCKPGQNRPAIGKNNNYQHPSSIQY